MKAYVQPPLSSTTYVRRNEVLTFKFYILSADEYSASHTLNILLWSNINNNTWSGIKFTEKSDEILFGCKEVIYRVFELEINTGVKEGWHEFTVRVHSSAWNDDEWNWLSEGENKNGKIFVGPPKEILLTSRTEKGIESIFSKDAFNRIENV